MRRKKRGETARGMPKCGYKEEKVQEAAVGREGKDSGTRLCWCSLHLGVTSTATAQIAELVEHGLWHAVFRHSLLPVLLSVLWLRNGQRGGRWLKGRWLKGRAVRELTKEQREEEDKIERTQEQ
eukprot:2941556-Rhodomonas_salina.1